MHLIVFFLFSGNENSDNITVNFLTYVLVNSVMCYRSVDNIIVVIVAPSTATNKSSTTFQHIKFINPQRIIYKEKIRENIIKTGIYHDTNEDLRLQDKNYIDLYCERRYLKLNLILIKDKKGNILNKTRVFNYELLNRVKILDIFFKTCIKLIKIKTTTLINEKEEEISTQRIFCYLIQYKTIENSLNELYHKYFEHFLHNLVNDKFLLNTSFFIVNIVSSSKLKTDSFKKQVISNRIVLTKTELKTFRLFLVILLRLLVYCNIQNSNRLGFNKFCSIGNKTGDVFAMILLITPDMALFGMVWLLRVRSEMKRCAKCRRQAEQVSTPAQTDAASQSTFFTITEAVGTGVTTPSPGHSLGPGPTTFCEVHGFMPPKDGKS